MSGLAARGAWSGGMTGNDLREKNRRVARVLLLIVAALVLAAFVVGVRW